MFVPKGRVLVIVAVDQLADVRRTAGQTDDDARNAAKVELKVEFYNGSSSTTIIDPRTGKTHTIFPERWGLEKSWTWLERGECLLTSGLVYPPLGISFNEDPTVSIFMSEQDLQRLKANWATKQETAPPPIPAATSGRGKQTAAVRAAFKKVFPNGIPVGMSSQTRNDKIWAELTTPLPDKRTIKRALKGFKGDG